MTQRSRPEPIPEDALDQVVGGAGQAGQDTQGGGVPGFDYGTPGPGPDAEADEVTEARPKTGLS